MVKREKTRERMTTHYNLSTPHLIHNLLTYFICQMHHQHTGHWAAVFGFGTGPGIWAERIFLLIHTYSLTHSTRLFFLHVYTLLNSTTVPRFFL